MKKLAMPRGTFSHFTLPNSSLNYRRMPLADIFNGLQKSALIRRFEEFLEPKSGAALEAMARESQALTLRYFGKAMRLFAPLYLSNECVNSCKYCGFSKENPILRVTLSVDEVVKEARHLSAAGFRQLLLVAGEHPKFVGRDYLAECVRALRDDYSSIS